MLRSITGPGVPSVLEFEETPRQSRLVLGVAPPLALSRLPSTSLVPALAQIAEVLARAHRAGICHGPIRDEDVLADGSGVLLTGWHRDELATPATDVLSFGLLLRDVAGADRSLQAIASRATAPDPPTMAGLAEALRSLTAPVVSSPRRRPPRRLRIIATLACAAATASLVFIGSSPPKSERTNPNARTARGNIVEWAGRRWAVGQPGDVVAIGRWSCDGRALPAVLRPATGDIWVFTGWPRGRAPVAGRPARSVPDAVRLRIRHDGPCDRLDAVDAQGGSTPVR